MAKGLGVVFVAAVALAIVYATMRESSTALPPARTAAQLQADARMDAARGAVAAIRKAMRDPGSLVIESAATSPAGDVACISYRAKNGFGGMGRELAVLVNGTVEGNASAALWHKHCSAGMADMKWAVQ